jgi:hypothetical protein
MNSDGTTPRTSLSTNGSSPHLLTSGTTKLARSLPVPTNSRPFPALIGRAPWRCSAKPCAPTFESSTTAGSWQRPSPWSKISTNPTFANFDGHPVSPTTSPAPQECSWTNSPNADSCCTTSSTTPQPEADLDEKLTFTPALFNAAGLVVTGPQLMALEIMERIDHRPRDAAAIPSTIAEGQYLAETAITRCHEERRSSVYLNLQLDDDSPGLSLDAAVPQSQEPGTIVIFRNQPPVAGTTAQVFLPPGVTLPNR